MGKTQAPIHKACKIRSDKTLKKKKYLEDMKHYKNVKWQHY